MASDNDGNSIFKTAILGAPIAIGIGMGISEFRKNTGSFGNTVSQIANPSPIHINPIISEFANKFADERHSGVFKDLQLGKLRDIQESMKTPGEVLRSAISDAVKRADPSGSLFASVQQKVFTSMDPKTMLGNFNFVMSNSSSIYAGRAVSSLHHNLSMMESRIASNLPYNPIASRATVKRRFTALRRSGQFSGGTKTELEALRASLGKGVKMVVNEFSRKDKAGSELSIKISDGEFGKEGFSLKVPRVDPDNPSIVTSGRTQQSRYIAGRYAFVTDGRIESTLNHEEYMIRRAREQLIPEMRLQGLKSPSVFRGMASKFNTELLEPLEWIMSAEHQGLDKYAAARSGLLHLQDSNFKPINDIAYADIFEQGGVKVGKGFFGLGEDYTWNQFQTATKSYGLDRNTTSRIYKQFQSTGEGFLPVFPGFSPAHMSKAIASMSDMRKNAGLLPDTVTFGHRPGRNIRQVSPTSKAVESMKQSKIDQAFSWAKVGGTVETPMLRAAYISGRHASNVSAFGLTPEGQFLTSESIGEIASVQKWRQFDVATDAWLDLGKVVSAQNTNSVYKELNHKVGENFIAGMGPNGKAVSLPNGFTIDKIETFEKDKNKGNFTRIVGYETIWNPAQAKYFGYKGMGIRTEDRILSKVLSSVGSSESGVDAIMMMDEFKKTRSLHYNQMLTSLWEFTQYNIDSGLGQSSIAQRFAQNPKKEIAGIRKLGMNHGDILERIVGLAREADLNPKQMGLVFGAVPDVFGNEVMSKKRGLFSAAEAYEINKGVAVGNTQLFFESVTGPGSGKTGTMEPRLWELLHSPSLGEAGAGIRTDIASRMIANNPDRLFEQKELTTSLESMLYPKKRAGAISAATALLDPEALAKGGTVASPLGDIVVPGSEAMRSMAGYVTQSGKNVEPELMTSYKRYFEAVKGTSAGEVSPQILQQEFERLQSEVGKARLGTITGTGGILRGRMPGSVQLTSIQRTSSHPLLKPGQIGVTKKYVKQMIGEMSNLGIYDEGELKSLRRRILSNEGGMGGIMRHPNIGPYSFQPTELKVIPGKEAIAVMPEELKKSFVVPGKMGLETFGIGLQNLGSPMMDAIAKDAQVSELLLRSSQAVGLAGDYDGDVVNVMVSEPRMQNEMRKLASDLSMNRMYKNYSIRSQLMKAGKSAAGDVSINQLMAGDALKMGVTQNRLGQVSSSLQKARAAVLSGYGNISPERRMNALGMLEWMEQTPISSKHIKAGEEKKMVGLFEEIQKSFKGRNRKGILSVIDEVIGMSNPIGQAAVGEGFTIAQEKVYGSGAYEVRHVPGLQKFEATDDIVKAMTEMEATKKSGQSAARGREMFMGKINHLTRSDLIASLSNDAAKSSYFNDFLVTGKESSLISRLSSRAQSISNKLMAAGSSGIPFAKKVGFGFAASVGLAMLLSTPKNSLGPGASTPIQPSTKGGTGGEHMPPRDHFGDQVNGSPTTQTHQGAANHARIASGSERGYDVTVNGGAGANTHLNSVSSSLRSVMPNSRMHTSIRDQRSSLTNRNMANILENK